jgi:hypothetical protein
MSTKMPATRGIPVIYIVDDEESVRKGLSRLMRSDDKKRARLNCIRHILSLIPYKKVPREKVKLPKRSMKGAYDDQASLKGRQFVPEKY